MKTVRKLSSVGRLGTKFMLKTSSGRLKAIDSIQRSGTTVMTPSTAVIRKRTMRAGLTARRPSKPLPAVLSAASAIDETTPAGDEEEEHGQRHQDEHEHRGHRRGIAEIVVLKGLLIDVVDGELGRVGRASLRHDVDEVEGLETAHGGDCRDEQDEEAGRLQERQRDVDERGDRPGAVDARRLVVFLGD